MGLDLTWSDKTREKRGACGPFLKEIVAVSLPEASNAEGEGFAASPERESNYIVNDANVWPVRELKFPPGPEGAAIEYTTMELPLTKEMAAERLRATLKKILPPDISDPDQYIEARIKDFLEDRIGSWSVLGGIVGDRLGNHVSVHKFIRWITREEFDQKVREAKARDKGEDDDISLRDAWYSRLKHEEQQEICKECDLSTYLGPKRNQYLELFERRTREAEGSAKREFLRDVFVQVIPEQTTGAFAPGPFASLAQGNSRLLSGVVTALYHELEKDPALKEEQKALGIEYANLISTPNYGCYRGSTHSHFQGFFEFIKQHGNFEILDTTYLWNRSSLPVKVLPNLAAELEASRRILTEHDIPAIEVFGKGGKKLGVYSNDDGHYIGNDMYGYGLIASKDKPAIELVFQNPTIFSIPVTERKRLLDEGGLAAITVESRALQDMAQKHYFTEIRRVGAKFVGTTLEGTEVLLPTSDQHDAMRSPFNGIQNENLVEFVIYGTAPAMESFAFIQRLFERHVEIAQKYRIPIRVSG